MAPFVYLAESDETIYTLVPSLERIAAVKIIIVLWSRNDVRTMINQAQLASMQLSGFPPYEWYLIERTVYSYVKQLLLPKLLEEEVLKFNSPIGGEILKWKRHHEIRYGCLQHYTVQLPSQLVWTAFGTIDPKLTAQALAKECTVSVLLQYKLACAYCLENEAKELWARIPDHCRNLIKSEIGRAASLDLWMLLHQWSHCRAGEGILENRLGAGNSYALEHAYRTIMDKAVRDSNRPAVKHFFLKVSAEHRRVFVAHSLKILHDSFCAWDSQSEVYFYLLSQLNAQDQQSAFVRYGFTAFRCCLIWPWPDLFIPVANCLIRFLPRTDYFCVLKCLVNKTLNGYKDCSYVQLVREFWKIGRGRHKSHTTESCALDCSLLMFMFKAEHQGNIELIWKAAKTEQRQSMLSYCKKKLEDDSMVLEAAHTPNYSTCWSAEETWEMLYQFLSGLPLNYAVEKKTD